MKKIFPLYAEDSEINILKERAKKQRQSTNQYILGKALSDKEGYSELKKMMEEIKIRK
jgi:hypothetical protein